MPLLIVRNDITRMQTDAIVNSTNEYLQCGGLGVDASIHAAAGTRLRAALNKIGHCPTGSAVITEAFDITQCRYIIHAVSPVYYEGRPRLEATLRGCYNSVFTLAAEHGCASLAMPVLCAGANGYPKREAYAIAASCARDFLRSYEGEMLIYLVIYDRDMVDISTDSNDTVTLCIGESYREKKKNSLLKAFGRHYAVYEDELPLEAPREYNAPSFSLSRKPDFASFSDESDDFMAAEPVPMPSYRMEDRSFGDMCAWWMQQKGIDAHEFYCRSNLSKATFSNIKKHPAQTPKKTTAFACVIGLRLNLEEAGDLLMRAGLTFSPYYKTDEIIKSYIQNMDYDIDAINLELFENDLALLGASAM